MPPPLNARPPAAHKLPPSVRGLQSLFELTVSAREPPVHGLLLTTFSLYTGQVPSGPSFQVPYGLCLFQAATVNAITIV